MPVQGSGPAERTEPNVGGRERLVSMVLGGALVAFGLTRKAWAGKLLALPGLMLFSRGRSGHSLLYTSLDVSTVPEPPAAPPPGRTRAAGAGAAGEGRPPAGGVEVAPGRVEASPGVREPEDVVAHAEPAPEEPRPQVPGTHEHPEPEQELGEPGVRATPKIMSEVSGPPPG